MREQKITIIVPVNQEEKKVLCEENLHRVQEEICGQTYKNIEVLWIISAGKREDFTFLETPKSFIIVNQNSTMAQMFNLGLERAQGAYVMFWHTRAKASKEYVFEMYQMMKHKHCDLVCSSYGGDEKTAYKEQRVYPWEEYLKKLTKHPDHDFYGMLWNKLYDMNLIRQNNLTFSEKVTSGYDFIFNMQYLNQKITIGILGKEFLQLSREDMEENTEDVYKVLIDRLNDKNAMFAAYKFLFWRAKVNVGKEVLDEYMIKVAALELAGILVPFSNRQWSVIRKKCLQVNGITGRKTVFRVIKLALRLRGR